jgi:hypothetical protein
MRGHRRSVSVPRNVKSLQQRSKTPSRKVEKRPEWNVSISNISQKNQSQLNLHRFGQDTIGAGDLSKMKLTAEELVKFQLLPQCLILYNSNIIFMQRNRRLQRVSKNRFFMDQAKAMVEGRY